MILGYRIEKNNSGQAIRASLQEATIKYKPNRLTFLTDGGSENVNTSVSSFLNSLVFTTKHIIVQKDVIFSNSMIEYINKVIKHQFLHPKTINSGNQLASIIEKSIPIYNSIRPQWSLAGNTPLETYNGIPLDFNKYKAHFNEQKILRLAQNKLNNCSICH